MPEPVRRDPLVPALAAGVCFFFYWLAWGICGGVLQFVGGQMVSITVSVLLAGVISNLLAMAIFESRASLDIGLGWREGVGRNLLLGIGLGAAGGLLAVLPEVAMGVARFSAAPGTEFSWRATCFLIVLLFCGAVGEEIAMRGFVFQYLARGYGNWPALILTSALFGLLHKTNPGATWLGVGNTALFGLLFGFALLRSHDLWLPIGLHFGWNATLPFLGVDLSGLTIKVAGYRLVWQADDLWSGGSYGPEAGLTATAVIAVLFIAVWKVRVQRNSAYLLEPSPAPSV